MESTPNASASCSPSISEASARTSTAKRLMLAQSIVAYAWRVLTRGAALDKWRYGVPSQRLGLVQILVLVTNVTASPSLAEPASHRYQAPPP